MKTTGPASGSIMRTRGYAVVTRFGTVSMEAFNIKEARQRAKLAFRVGPEAVTAERAYQLCAACDSRPCTCKEGASC